MKIREKELSFEFFGAQSVKKLDEQGDETPSGMSLVDFVIEEEQRILLVEVKDPSADQIPVQHRKSVKDREIRKFQTKELIHDELVPKARDSYCYLHLMKRDSKPFDYVYLTSIDRLGINSELLMNFHERLLKRLRKEADEKWKRYYIRDCAVHTLRSWNQQMAPYTVERI